MKAAVWVCVHDVYMPPKGQVLMEGTCCLIGLGPMQVKAELTETTIGAIRADWGMDELAPGMAGDRQCWLYTHSDGIGDGSNNLTMVLVEV